MASSSSDRIESLRTRLEAKNNYFKRMVNLIPATPYLAADQEANQQTFDPKKKGKSEKIDEKSHKKGKQKRQRLDPKQKNVTDMQIEKAEKEAREIDGEAVGSSKDEQTDSEEEEEDDDGDDDDDDEMQGQSKSVRPISVENVQSNLTIDELRQKLHSKIKKMRGKRKAVNDDDAGHQETKRQKRMERKKMKKKKKEILKSASRNAAIKSLSVNSPKISNKQTEVKPVTNNEGKVVFSKFDFSESNESKQKKRKKVKQTGRKKLELLLKHAETKREKLNELKNREPEKALSQEHKQAWKKALQKAEGTKQTDDPELLKKAIKRKDQLKTNSKKHWDERRNVTENLVQKRQDKRNRNIKARKQEKLQKKIKKLKKKGRILPGF